MSRRGLRRCSRRLAARVVCGSGETLPFSLENKGVMFSVIVGVWEKYIVTWDYRCVEMPIIGLRALQMATTVKL